MREQARGLITASRSSVDPIKRRETAERAFELAQFAEREERRLFDVIAAVGPGAGVRLYHLDAAAGLLQKARRWRKRAEEYWAVSEALRTPLARETYAHLARSYEKLADHFEARARSSLGNKPSRKEKAG